MKNLLVLLCFLSITSNLKSQNSVPTFQSCNIFYQDEKTDTVIAELFQNANLLLKTVLRTDAVTVGENIAKQVTLKTVVAYTANGEQFYYEKSFIIGIAKGENFVFFTEVYPKGIGALYQNADRKALAASINKFLETSINGYIYGRKFSAQKTATSIN